MPFSVERRSTRVAGKTCQRLQSAAAVAPNTYAIQRVAGSAHLSLPQRLFTRPFRCAGGLSFKRERPNALASRARLLLQTQHCTLACLCASLRCGVPSEPAAPLLAKRHLACRGSCEWVGGSSVRTWVTRIAFAVVAAGKGLRLSLTHTTLAASSTSATTPGTRHTCCDLITRRLTSARYNPPRMKQHNSCFEHTQAASARGRLPAKFKHINKRRKRNQQGFP